MIKAIVKYSWMATIGWVVWLLVVVLRFLFDVDYEVKFFFASFWDGLLVVVGVGMVVVMGVNVYRKQRRWLNAVVIFLMVLLAYIGWETSVGWKAGAYFKLWRCEAEYDKWVARVFEGDRNDYTNSESRHEIDEGPPVRVAFPWISGWTDNWIGVVYDPTGLVLQVNELDRDDPVSRDVRGLFRGELYYAWYMWGDWYYCAFT
ncbi:MAG: hypothetical protein GY869_20280 [Planctomycetes bacterium]|nr:hypothetical protein [Planctomycetota bacterium]